MNNFEYSAYFYNKEDSNKRAVPNELGSEDNILRINKYYPFYLESRSSCRETICSSISRDILETNYLWRYRYNFNEFYIKYPLKITNTGDRYISFLRNIEEYAPMLSEFYIENSDTVVCKFDPEYFNVPKMSFLLYFIKYAYIFADIEDFNENKIIERLIKTSQYNSSVNKLTAFALYLCKNSYRPDALGASSSFIHYAEYTGISDYMDSAIINSTGLANRLWNFLEEYDTDIIIGLKLYKKGTFQTASELRSWLELKKYLMEKYNKKELNNEW